MIKTADSHFEDRNSQSNAGLIIAVVVLSIIILILIIVVVLLSQRFQKKGSEQAYTEDNLNKYHV